MNDILEIRKCIRNLMAESNFEGFFETQKLGIRKVRGRIALFRGVGQRGLYNIRSSEDGIFGPGVYWYTTAKEARAYAGIGGGIIAALGKPENVDIYKNVCVTNGTQGVDIRGYIPTDMTIEMRSDESWRVLENAALALNKDFPVKEFFEG